MPSAQTHTQASLSSQVMCGIGAILKITKPGETYAPIPESWLDSIDAEIAWRGPDGSGRFRDAVTLASGATIEVAMVHRRLSIIDHTGGGQPFIVKGCPACDAANREHRRKLREIAADRNVELQHINDAVAEDLTAVVFNGCIYNHRELRAELESLGHVFTSDHSDTEVIAHAWSQWRTTRPEIDNWKTDPGISNRLDGMYAIALWNRGDAMLWTARDRYGEKPLYVARDFLERPNPFVVASTARALESFFLQSRSCPTDEPFGAITPTVAFGFPTQWFDKPIIYGVPTAIPGVMEHARYFTVDPDIVQHEIKPETREDFWKGFAGCLVGLSAIAGIAVLLYQLVRGVIALMEFLISVFTLAGLVLLIVKIIIPWRLMRGRHVRILARTMPDVADDVISKAVAMRLEADVPLGCFLSGGIDSSLIAYYAHERIGNLRTFCVRMPDERYDESAYAQRVADTIGTHHTTIDCDASHAADDLVHLIQTLGLPFGDSSILPTYWLCKAARAHVKVALSGDGGDEMFFGYERYRAAPYLTRLLTPYARHKLRHLDRSDPRSRDERLARFYSAAVGAGYLDLLAVFPCEDACKLFDEKRVRYLYKRVSRSARAARSWDIDNYLPGDLMRKVDTASMTVGLEVRSPLLSKEVAKFADEIPAGAHMFGETKHLLKELARRHLGDAIADRPKQGFAIPISEWWRNDFGGLRTLLFDYLDKPKPFGVVHDALPINMDYVRQMIDEHWVAGGLTPIYSTRHVQRRDHGQRLFSLLTLAIWARDVEHPPRKD